MLLQNKYATCAVVVLLAGAIYWHFHRDKSMEKAMVKELEYVIEQQAQEITDLKSQLAKPVPHVVEKQILQIEKICPVPLKQEHLPCTIKDPGAIIAIRGYRDESIQSNTR